VDTSETVTLRERTVETITVAARAMYPHERLPDDVYGRVGQRLAEAAREDPAAEWPLS
jgi:hypothetical protein